MRTANTNLRDTVGVPDVPANANAATLKATVSLGKTKLNWS